MTPTHKTPFAPLHVPDRNMPWRPGARRGRHEQAADLPGPLFILYCQLEAYCDFVQGKPSFAVRCIIQSSYRANIDALFFVDGQWRLWLLTLMKSEILV